MPRVINFSEAASIGIHASIHIARANRPMNAIELSEKLGASKHNIGKVLQRLVKDGILQSYRGPTGGFALKKDPSQLLIYDIYRSIDGEIDHQECPRDSHICPLDKCIRDTIIRKMTQDFANYLKENTLQDFL